MILFLFVGVHGKQIFSFQNLFKFSQNAGLSRFSVRVDHLNGWRTEPRAFSPGNNQKKLQLQAQKTFFLFYFAIRPRTRCTRIDIRSNVRTQE